jgi:type II secretory pathway pseudopilin PulG
MRNKSSQGGFTIIEIVVMAAIISIGVLATVGVATLATNTSSENGRRVEAANLAREGLELVRNIRDSNWQQYYAQTQNGIPATRQWDCFNNDSSGTVPLTPSCDDRFSNFPTPVSPDSQRSFRLLNPDPSIPNSVATLHPGTGTATFDTEYQICYTPATPSGPAYYHTQPSGTCPQGTQTYYRRIVLKPGKINGGVAETVKVESRVTWLTKKNNASVARDLLLEEYLTDWRQFKQSTSASATVLQTVNGTAGACTIFIPGQQCLVSGSTRYANAASAAQPFRTTYNFGVRPAGNYTVELTYRNMGVQAPLNYTYSLRTYVNLTQIVGSPLQLGPEPGGTAPRTVQIPITLSATGALSVRFEWINDLTDATGNSNFGIDQVRLLQ